MYTTYVLYVSAELWSGINMYSSGLLSSSS